MPKRKRSNGALSCHTSKAIGSSNTYLSVDQSNWSSSKKQQKKEEKIQIQKNTLGINHQIEYKQQETTKNKHFNSDDNHSENLIYSIITGVFLRILPHTDIFI